MKIRPPKFIKKLFPTFIWNFPDEKEGIFLTFDDGPRPEVTPWLLDLLDKYDAKATFFCIITITPIFISYPYMKSPEKSGLYHYLEFLFFPIFILI